MSDSTHAEIERVARDFVERCRSDAYGQPDPGDWDHIRTNKPFAYAQAMRVAKWALSIPRA